MDKYRVGTFVADPDRNAIIAADGTETRLEPKVMAVLGMLARCPGDVLTRQDLIDGIWRLDYGAEDAPTRAISKLRKVFGDSGNGSRYIETIPKRGYRLVAPVLAMEAGTRPNGEDLLPDSAPFPAPSGAGEPAGPAPARTAGGGGSTYGTAVNGAAVRPEPSHLAQIASLARFRRPVSLPAIAASAAAAMAALLVLGGWLETGGERQTNQATIRALTNGKTIAVLPLENRTAQGEEPYLADGFHDALLTQLSKLQAVRVISRASVMQYRDTKKPLPQIAQELGAAVVLEGSVQRSGKHVRINVQLIDGTTDTHIWAENYDRPLTAGSLFAVQSEITRSIAGALEAALTDSDEIVLADLPTGSQEAYEAYIRGRIAGNMSQLNEESFRQAIQHYDEAIRLDPQFAEAYASKAKTYLFLYWYFGSHAEDRQSADDALNRAEALAPETIETLLARAYYHYYGFFDFDRADVLLKRALEKAPHNAEIWQAVGFVARRDGRFDEAVTALDNARRLDPRNVGMIANVAETAVLLGRLRRGQDLMAQAMEINSTSPRVNYISYYMARALGDAQLAWQVANVAMPLDDGVSRRLRCEAAWYLRSPQKIRSVLADWPEQFRRPNWDPEVYNKCRWQLLDSEGREDEARALGQEIFTRMKNRPDLVGWRHFQVTPAQLAYFTRDLEHARGARAKFEAEKPKDAYGNLNNLYRLGLAFLVARDPETGFDFLDAWAGRTAPSKYLLMSANPDLDEYRGHPRYLALKAKYDAWAAENPDQLAMN